MARVPVGQKEWVFKEWVYVDERDLSLLSRFKWYLMKGPWASYATTKIKGKTIYMHRFLLKAPKRKQVDHINGNGLDNRRSNLRLATVSEQAANSKSKKKRAPVCSSYKGVSWHNTKTGGCWRAELEQKTKGKRKRYIKYASTQEQAALLYNALALEHFGVFAKVNEIT